MLTRRVFIFALVVIVLGAGAFFVFHKKNISTPTATELVRKNTPDPQYEVVGSSVLGRPIEAYTYGTGKTHLLFVGGIHGGYEWNSVLLTYTFMDYLKTNPEVVPQNVTVTVIPSANPDGVFKIIGKTGRFALADVPTTDSIAQAPGRFNAHMVDLNRNFDCKWQKDSMWRGNVVSGGQKPFSEPESAAIRDFVLKTKPTAVIFWHSQANAVYASACENGILPQTLEIMNAYAKASGYPAVESFDAYAVTGDAEGWLSSIGIPAITVELKTHETIEWERNISGIKALLHYFEIEEVASSTR